MPTTLTEEAPIDVTIYRSPRDGALVVEIDTQVEAGRVRVNLNDGILFDADPESESSLLTMMSEAGVNVTEENLTRVASFLAALARTQEGQA